MINIVRRQTTYLFKQKNIKKYSITHQGLEKFIKLKPRAQELLKDMLTYIGSSTKTDSVIFDVTYSDLGFTSFRIFWKYRNELIKTRFLFYKDNKYFINPCFINYYNRRQQGSFFSLFKLKKSTPVIIGPLLRIVN